MGIGRFPICVAALSLVDHRNSGSMLTAETAGLEVIFSGLALIFLRVAKKRKASAETEALPEHTGQPCKSTGAECPLLNAANARILADTATNIRNHRHANGRKAICSGLTDAVTSMAHWAGR